MSGRMARRSGRALRLRAVSIALTCSVLGLPCASNALDHANAARVQPLSGIASDSDLPAGPEATSEARAAAPSNAYVASDASIVQIFDALSSIIGKPVIASPNAARKRVSGRFDLGHPRRVLERLCADLGLVSYFDGNVVYVYDMSEITNAMGSLKWIDVRSLRTFLSDSGIASPTFPVRGDDASRTFYVAGPPVYVDAVVSAAKNLDHAEIDSGQATNSVKVIPLKHTFVRDRIFRLRDQMIKVPGVASVLAEMLDQHPDPVSDGRLRSTTPASTSGDDSVNRPASSGRTDGETDGQAAKANIDDGYSGVPLPPQVPDSPMPPFPAFQTPAGRQRAMSRAIRVSHRPVVLAYPDTNSLLVKGRRDEIEYLSQLISQLDVEKTQIELSLWIIDIQRDTLEQLGVRWQGGFNSGPLGLSFNSNAAMSSGGFSTLDGARFLASAFALSSKGDAQIVSRPLILTQENVPALFDNNQTFYAKLIGERTSNLQQITYGTLISVIPRLSVDHADIEMILDIEDGKTVDTGTDADMVDGLPVVGRTHISTIARVPRSMSLLIGGYTQHKVDTEVTRVPLLSDIPLLGALFRYRNTSATDMVRVFLIQPRVLTNRAAWDPSEFSTDAELSPGINARAAASVLERTVERTATGIDAGAATRQTPDTPASGVVSDRPTERAP